MLGYGCDTRANHGRKPEEEHTVAQTRVRGHNRCLRSANSISCFDPLRGFRDPVVSDSISSMIAVLETSYEYHWYVEFQGWRSGAG